MSGEITYNANLRRIEALMRLAVIDRDLTSPPGSPADGDVYLIATSATGAWSGQDDDITWYDGSSWIFFTPVEGMRMYVNDENVFLVYDGATWGAV